MKKIFVSMAFAAMMFAPLSVMAQNTATTNTAPEKTCCNTDGQCDKSKESKDRKGDKRADGRKMEKRNPFEGLNLTADQQTKIQQLNEKRKADHEKMKAERKEKMKAAKENGNNPKENAQRPSREEMAAKRQADQKAYLTEIQSILTPDQYVVFLENFYTNSAPQGSKHMGKAAMKGGKHMSKAGKQEGRKSAKQMDKAGKMKAQKQESNLKATV